jgi:putative membrane protein
MTTSPGLLDRTSDRTFYVFNAILSAVALGFIAWILMIRKGGAGGVDLRFLPAVNASLNAVAALLLTAGWIAIRNKAARAHKFFMTSAFATSSLFLVSYLVYHYAHGDTKFTGQGPIRAVYFFTLITHIVLSMGVVPMALAAFWFAWKKEFQKHRKVTRWLAPIWLYVSVTGVAIFFMLRGSAPAVP